MESRNQPTFEEEWQEAFKDASMPPPDYLWDNIERELDDKKRRRPFLFILRPASLAAGIAAALLVVVGGFIYFNKTNSDLAVKPVILPKTIEKQSKSTNNQAVAKNKTNSISQKYAKETPTQISKNEMVLSEKTLVGSQNKILKINNGEINTKEKVEISLSKTVEIANPMIDISNNSIITENTVNTINSEKSNNPDYTVNSGKLLSEANELEGKQFRTYGNRFGNKRKYLFFEGSEPIEEKDLAKNESKFWIGLQSGGGSFNPNMKLGGLNTVAGQQADAFANSNKAGTVVLDPLAPTAALPAPIVVSQPKSNIQSGLAINTGVAFGYKLSKKWHLESGLRYLRGNTTLQSNTFALQEANGYSNIFLADYLAQKSSNVSQKSNAVVADATQVNNRYEYLMIPIQGSYGIELSQKIRLDILAGFSTDIFVNNIIKSDLTSFIRETTFDSKSNTYKPLNISGLGGIRANYLVGKHWQASIGSSYQQALFSGINTNTNLKMQMRLWGLNYGLNYRF